MHWNDAILCRSSVISWESLFVAILRNHARYKCMIFNDIRIVHLRLLRVNRGVQLIYQFLVSRLLNFIIRETSNFVEKLFDIVKI